MSDFSEKEWKSALTSILEHLDSSQHRKMLGCLEKIPKGKWDIREEMPQVIIEHYGPEESVHAIREAMEELPRRDSAVQDLLRPFVDKLRNSPTKENQGQKRKRELEEEERPPTAEERSCRPAEESNPRPWKKSLCELKSGSELCDTDAVTGKVFQKSGLRSYKTKNDLKRFFFYVSVADETGCVKMMAYEKKLYQQIQEEKSYVFRRLIRDADNGFLKVTSKSRVSRTSCIEVPETIETEARTLIYSESPVCSVTEAKSSADRTLVSVRGAVTEIDPIEEVNVRDERKKTIRQNFSLKDETDSIQIFMWGEATRKCKGLSVGDVIRVINVKTNKYHGTVSLNSTAFTDIQKDRSVGIQNARIQMIGVKKATKRVTHLVAEFNEQVHTFVVASRLLADAFDFKLEGDLTEILLGKMKLPVDVVTQGNKITKITKITTV